MFMLSWVLFNGIVKEIIKVFNQYSLNKKLLSKPRNVSFISGCKSFTFFFIFSYTFYQNVGGWKKKKFNQKL